MKGGFIIRKSFESYEFADLDSLREKELEERENKLFKGGFKKMREEFNEDYFFENKENWLLGLYEKINDYCINIKRGVKTEFRKTYIKWSYSGIMFCRVFVFRDNLKLYLKLKYEEIEKAPAFVRDYSDKVRGIPTVEIVLNEEYLENEEAFSTVVRLLINKAFSGITGAKKLRPVKKIEVEPAKLTEVFRPSLNLIIDGNGYIDVHFKIKKEQRELLNRILQETILK